MAMILEIPVSHKKNKTAAYLFVNITI